MRSDALGFLSDSKDFCLVCFCLPDGDFAVWGDAFAF